MPSCQGARCAVLGRFTDPQQHRSTIMVQSGRALLKKGANQPRSRYQFITVRHHADIGRFCHARRRRAACGLADPNPAIKNK